MRAPKSLQALRHRTYAIFWAGAFVSTIGSWMETTGVGVLVQSSTGKAGWTALVAAAGFLPIGLFSPLGGALADHFHRRNVMLVSTSLSMVFAGALAIATLIGTPHPLIVIAIVFSSGCTFAVTWPAFQSMLPDLVPEEDLPGAIALGIGQYNLGRVLGPALAGILLRNGDFALTFLLNTLSFLAVIIVLLVLNLPSPHRTFQSIRKSIGEGIRYVTGDAVLRPIIALYIPNAFLIAPFIALVPSVAGLVFGNELRYTAVLLTAQGLGAVLMAIFLGGLHARFGNRNTLFVVIGLLPVAVMAYAIAPTIRLAAVGIFAVAFFYLGTLSTFTTIAQLRSPREIRGRVASTMMMLLGIMYPLGAVFQGWLADRIGGGTGLRITMILTAALMLIIQVVFHVRRPNFAEEATT